MLASACWVGSDQVARKVGDVPTETDTDTDTPIGELAFIGLSATVGSNAGGLAVQVKAETLDPADVEVTFGGVPATIVGAEAEVVEVLTPAVGLEGSVDVVVRSAGRTVRAPSAFYYWEDGQDRAGLLGTVNNYDFERGYDLASFFGDSGRGYPEQARGATLLFSEPVQMRWWEVYADALDTCVRDHTYQGESVVFLQPGFDGVDLDDLELESNDDGDVYFLDRERGSWTPGALLDLELPEGGPGWLAGTVGDAVRMPRDGFRVSSPNMDSNPAFVDSPNFDLRWTGGTAGDVVLVQMYRYNSLGSLQDDVTCALVDDGQHSIPAGVFTGWAIGGPMAVAVGRATESSATLPWNGAEVRVYGVSWWYGGFYQSF